MNKLVAVLLSMVALPACAVANPCAGMAGQLTKEQEVLLNTQVSKQLGMRNAQVIQVLRFENWQILYADTHQSDEVFLFYAQDPLSSHFITMWSGAALRSEQESIRNWAVKNAPGIPEQLSRCFAYHVTQDRTL